VKTLTPLKAMRATCLDCCCGSAKAVAYCPCDGEHSTRCEAWPFRFGFRPENVHPREFVTPGALPGSNEQLEDLPAPKITRKSSKSRTPAQQKALERMRQAREAVPV